VRALRLVLIPAAVVLTLLAAASCARPRPVAIHYDADACDRCRMTISDAAFAGQLVTRTGKVYRFDDPACLATFARSGQVKPADIHSIWINDHAHPDSLVRAEGALFVVSTRIRAPMNGMTAAFAGRDDAMTLQSSVGGDVLTWTDLLTRGPS
jgi:copper chaperone NosL